jgi:hypothetical protein
VRAFKSPRPRRTINCKVAEALHALCYAEGTKLETDLSSATEGEREMTGRDIFTVLGIFAGALAATVLTWWLAERAYEYFLYG